MIPRSCVIQVCPAPTVSPVRILPVRAGPGWRGGRCQGGLGRQARGRAADRWAPLARALTLSSRERGQCRVPATAATAAGRDAPAGMRR
jgi:hypothetical protein